MVLFWWTFNQCNVLLIFYIIMLKQPTSVQRNTIDQNQFLYIKSSPLNLKTRVHLAHCFISVAVHLCWCTIQHYCTLLASVVTFWLPPMTSSGCFLYTYIWLYFLFNCFDLWQGVQEVYLLVVIIFACITVWPIIIVL